MAGVVEYYFACNFSHCDHNLIQIYETLSLHLEQIKTYMLCFEGVGVNSDNKGVHLVLLLRRKLLELYLFVI